jgi:hypothetical protein
MLKRKIELYFLYIDCMVYNKKLVFIILGIYNFALNLNANTIDFRFFLTFLDVTYDGV